MEICYNYCGDIMNLEDVFKALEDNQQIDNALKENIKELITVFHNAFPNYDLTDFKERLKTLKIAKKSKFVTAEVMNYDLVNNRLNINQTKLEEDYDARYVLMVALLLMITARTSKGKEKTKDYASIYAGFTSSLASTLVGNESDKTLYEDEVIAVNLLKDIIGSDAILNMYFENEPLYLFNAIQEANLDELEIKTILDKMNFNYSYYSCGA